MRAATRLSLTLPLTVLLATACEPSDDDADGTDTADTEDTQDTEDTEETDDTVDTGDTDPGIDGPTYAFLGRDGGDSVSYGGQVFRQLLIDDMKRWISGLDGRLKSDFFPVEGEVAGELEFYVDFDDGTGAAVPIGLTTTPPTTQTTYADVSSGKDLVGKIAGNDPVGQHEDWTVDFVGWDHPSVTTPESLVRLWIDQLDDAAVAWGDGSPALGPDGSPVPAFYVTADGLDLQQLLEKFLRGAVAFSQAADDYLDDADPGKGLLADHTALSDGASYTALEHQWDEGFGYFGASVDYANRSDDDVADMPAFDSDGDGAIDVLREVTFGHATNASKRDRGAVVATDFSALAWEGFYEGRKLLADTTDALDTSEAEALAAWRDQAIENWEKAIAATVVHYINDTLQDVGAFDTTGYDFAAHAKHWAEMKGFALSFQFNPRSPLSDADFATLHTLLGQAPVLETADATERQDHVDDLLAARALLGTAYGFDDDNLGADDGTGGW